MNINFERKGRVKILFYISRVIFEFFSNLEFFGSREGADKAIKFVHEFFWSSEGRGIIFCDRSQSKWQRNAI